MRVIFPQVVLAMQMVRLYSQLLGILIFLLALLWALKVRVLLREVVVP
jgi:hypothetical protein